MSKPQTPQITYWAPFIPATRLSARSPSINGEGCRTANGWIEDLGAIMSIRSHFSVNVLSMNTLFFFNSRDGRVIIE